VLKYRVLEQKKVWAVAFEDDERIYFVAETKGVDDIYSPHLSDSERDRILAGRQHFAELGVAYIAPTNSLGDTFGKLLDRM
jgi:restriction endonuclease